MTEAVRSPIVTEDQPSESVASPVDLSSKEDLALVEGRVASVKFTAVKPSLN